MQKKPCYKPCQVCKVCPLWCVKTLLSNSKPVMFSSRGVTRGKRRRRPFSVSMLCQEGTSWQIEFPAERTDKASTSSSLYPRCHKTYNPPPLTHKECKKSCAFSLSLIQTVSSPPPHVPYTQTGYVRRQFSSRDTKPAMTKSIRCFVPELFSKQIGVVFLHGRWRAVRFNGVSGLKCRHYIKR